MQNLVIGIVATAQHQDNLKQVLESIRVNRPTQSIHIFAEPGEYVIDTDKNTTRHINEVQLGCFCNHANAAERLTNPENSESKYVILTQDDFVFADNARERINDFLNNVKTPFGFLGLYTSPKKIKDIYKRNWQEINFGYSSYGVSYFMRTEILAEVIHHPFFINHFITYERNQQVDSTIGYVIYRMNLPTFYYNPSVTKHIGESTIGHYDPENNKFVSKDTPSHIGVILKNETGDKDIEQITKSSVYTQVDYFRQYDDESKIDDDSYLFNIKPGIIYPANYVQTSIGYIEQLKCPITRGAEYDVNVKGYNFDRNSYLPEPLYNSALSFNLDTATFALHNNHQGADVVCVPHNAKQFKEL